MNKELHKRLNLFVSLTRLDFRPNNNNIEMIIVFPYYIRFDIEVGLLIEEAVKGWFLETIKPVMVSIESEFASRTINDDLINDAMLWIQQIDRDLISKGDRSIKDQLRFKLGLLPDVSNIQKREG